MAGGTGAAETAGEGAETGAEAKAPAPAEAAPPVCTVVEEPGRHRIYITVFVLLALFTVLELSVNPLLSVKSHKIAALVFLMLAKASLVVLYYMHMRYESRVLRWALLVPFVMAVFFALVVIVD
jgi:caa(3)-type oxidase subunit IV